MVPSGNALVGIADRAGYPVLTVPAGYGTGGAGRNPIGVTFVAKAGDEAGLLNAGYAFEQATNVRLAPSFTNPSMFRCVEGSTFFSPHHCHPGDVLSPTADGPTETPVAGDVGGTVPATLSLTLGANASFGAFTPGIARTYTASTTANVISTAGDAALTVSEPGRLMNGTFTLTSPLRVAFSKSTWTGPGLERRGDGLVRAGHRGQRAAAHGRLLQDAHVHAVHHHALTLNHPQGGLTPLRVA